MRCELIPVTGKHVKHVAAKMRQRDVDEIWSSDRLTPRAALEKGVATSVFCRTGMVNREPACILGVTPASMIGGVGVPWMLATPKVERATRPLLRLSRPLVDVMQSLFPLLVNYVDNRNVKTIVWLEALGFHVEPAEPHGFDGDLFRKFTRRG